MVLDSTDLELQEQIRRQPYFHKEGRFDYETYNTVLSQNSIVRHEYEDSLRHDLMAGKLQELLTQGLIVGSNEVEEIFRLENEKLEINYLHFKPETFMPQITVSAEEVRSHFAELAVSAAEKIISRSLDKKTHEKLISDVLDDATKINGE